MLVSAQCYVQKQTLEKEGKAADSKEMTELDIKRARLEATLSHWGLEVLLMALRVAEEIDIKDDVIGKPVEVPEHDVE